MPNALVQMMTLTGGSVRPVNWPRIFPRIRRHWLLGNSSLVLRWRLIPQGGMQPPVVVIAKIAAKREPQRPGRREVSTVDELGLQGMKERFHVRIVAGGAPAGRTLANAQGAEPIAKRVAGILAAPITMEKQPGAGTAAADGRIQNSPRQAGVAGAAQPPGEHPAGALVQHDGEKAPPTADREICDVADPDPIGPR